MTQADLFIQRDAAVSDCGRYRWSLSRAWDRDPLKPWVGWIMLNPSTADANVDDPTIRRCMGFSRGWGYAGMTVMNLFTLRATDPAELLAAWQPNGPPEHQRRIDQMLVDLPGVCRLVIAAWGCDGSHRGRDREVFDLFASRGLKLMCLGMTKNGHPKHPLARGKHRIPDNFAPVPFAAAGGGT